MGRDDNCQSIGMYSNRLRKTPPTLRFAARHRGATMDKAAVPFSPLISATRAQGTTSGLKTEWRKEHNFKDEAIGRSLLDLALPAAVADAPSDEISIDESERLLQQHAARKELISENEPAGCPKNPPSSAACERDTLKARLSPWKRTQVQNDKAQRETVRSSQSQTIPAEMLKKFSRNKYSSALWSDAPEPNCRFVLARPEKKEKTLCPLNAHPPPQISDEHLPRARSPSWSQHIRGETYENSTSSFNRRFGTTLGPEYLQQSRKRPLHEMNEAGADAQSGSRTPLDTPPKSAKKADLEGARKRYQAYTASVSSTTSAAEADLKGDTEESKDDIEKELAGKMRKISLGDDILHPTPSDSPYGPNSGAAKDRLTFEAPDGLGIIPKKRKSKAQEDYELGKKALEKPGADTIANKSKIDLPERFAGDTALRKAKLQAKRGRKFTQDHLDHLNRITSHAVNAKDLDNLRAKMRIERLPIKLRSTNYPSPSSQAPKPRLLFIALPFELRRLIYLHLLTTPKPIHGGELLEDARTTIIVPAVVPPILDLSISAAILRTCRSIYTEALPILYQENCFLFSKVSMLLIFRVKGLVISRTPGDVPIKRSKSMLQYLDSISTHDFAFNAEPQGRLCLLRNVHLRFRYPGRAPSLRGMRSPLRDDLDWVGGFTDPWSDFLNEERYADDVAGYVTFPALKNLVLDFSDWELKPCEGLRIRIFERRFRGEEGLRELTTVGLGHAETIEAFRGMLLGSGGVMKVLERGAFAGAA